MRRCCRGQVAAGRLLACCCWSVAGLLLFVLLLCCWCYQTAGQSRTSALHGRLSTRLHLLRRSASLCASFLLFQRRPRPQSASALPSPQLPSSAAVFLRPSSVDFFRLAQPRPLSPCRLRPPPSVRSPPLRPLPNRPLRKEEEDAQFTFECRAARTTRNSVFCIFPISFSQIQSKKPSTLFVHVRSIDFRIPPVRFVISTHLAGEPCLVQTPLQRELRPIDSAL